MNGANQMLKQNKTCAVELIQQDNKKGFQNIVLLIIIMKTDINLLVLIAIFVYGTQSLVNTICSIYCPSTACNGTGGYNICQSCDSVFDLNTTQTPTCQVQPLTGYCFQSITPTTLTASYTSYPQYAAGGSITNVHGWFSPSQVISISNPGITRQYYSIKIIFGILQKGTWVGPQQVQFKFLNTNTTDTRGIMTRDVALMGTCSAANDDYYSRHILDYTYTTQNTTLNWQVSISGSGGAGASWAFNQVILLLKSCYQRCDGCSPTNCMQCTACQTSGTYQSYFITATSRCVAASDCPASTFANSATHRCESCSIANCQTCSTATVCGNCSTGYYLYSGSCVASCPAGYFGDNSVTPKVCTQCASQCTVCTSSASTSCSACTTSGTYQSFLNGTSCVSSTSCPTGKYAQTANHTCSACNTSCVTCQGGQNNCTQCASGLYILNNVCYSNCPNGYYQSAASQKQCLACDNRCQICDVSATNCSSCTSSGTYQSFLTGSSCVASTSCPASTYAQSANHTCTGCNASCASCSSSANSCTQCVSGLYILNNICYSDCPDGYYESAAPQKQCLACDSRCRICTTSASTCTACTTSGTYQSYLVSSSSSCVASCPAGTTADVSTHQCVGAGAITCSQFCQTCTGPSAYQCSSCYSSQHRVLVGQQCQCDAYNYRQSSTGPTCEQINPNLCQQGYLYSSSLSTCVQICGDGMRMGYDCDDGNLVNSDGCSNQCQVQDGYTCSNTGTQKSVCKLIAQVVFTSISITKDPYSNTIYMSISILPQSYAYYNYNLPQYLTFSPQQLTISSATYSFTQSKLSITANYSTNLQATSIQLQVKQSAYYNQSQADPNSTQTTYSTSRATFRLSASAIFMTSDNNLQINAYSDQQYSSRQIYYKINLTMLIVGLVVSCVCLVIKNSISTMININSIQMCYLSLSSMRGFTPITSSLLVLRYILGYNDHNMFAQTNTFPQSSSESQSMLSISSIGFVQAYSNNFNIMLFIQISIIALASMFTLAAQNKHGIVSIVRFLQRQALLIVMFNMPIVFYSISLIKYITIYNIIFPICAVFIVAYLIFSVIRNKLYYYGFQQMFNLTDSGHFSKFIIIFFITRVSIFISLSLINLPIYICLGVPMALSTLFIIFIVFFRPFYHLLSNIFIIVGELFAISFMVCVLAIDMWNISDVIQGNGILIYLIAGIVLTALANLMHGIYLDCAKQGKKIKAINQSHQEMEVSAAKIKS